MPGMQFVIHVSCVIPDRQNDIPLVQERKQAAYGKYNLSGGHLEIGEKLEVGVKRGGKRRSKPGRTRIFSGYFHRCRETPFCEPRFCATIDQKPEPQFNEMFDCKWLGMDEILGIDEEQLLNPAKLKLITTRVKDNTLYPTDLINGLIKRALRE